MELSEMRNGVKLLSRHQVLADPLNPKFVILAKPLVNCISKQVFAMTISVPIPLYLSTDSVKLPIFRGASCGWPSPAADYREAPLSLDELVGISACSTFLARATGTSMTGAGIHSGDILVIDKSRDAVPGNVVVAIVDGEFTVKRLAQEGRQLSLVSENPAMAPLTFGDGEEVMIWGVVSWSLHRHL